MQKIIYGVFHDRSQAERAVRDAERHSGHRLPVAVHEGSVTENDVPLSGTTALRGAILGGLLVGVLGSALAALFVAPHAGTSFGVWDFVFVALGGSLFGVIAGGAAGAAECKAEVRRLVDRLEGRDVLVSVEAQRSETPGIQSAFLDAGARDVLAA